MADLRADPVFLLSSKRADLPVGIFTSGMSRAQMMEEAYRRALAILEKYIGGFRYTPEQAQAVLSDVETWVENNRSAIEATMANEALDTLPEQLQFQLGAEKAQQFIVAGFVSAAQGYGTWTSGAVEQYVAEGKLDQWTMDQDLTDRLEVFLSIISMEQHGELDRIFHPEKYPQPSSEGGAQLVIIAIVLIIAVVVAATFIVYSVAMKRMDSANRIHEMICEDAIQRGDRELINKCLDQNQALRMMNPVDDLWKGVVPALVIVGGIYVVSVYGVPALINALFRRKKS